MDKARLLFDDIFRNHLTVIHDYHEARLQSLITDAHAMNQDDVIVADARGMISRNVTFSILMADIDRFKLFNDTYGHQAGDKLLMEFADHLRKGLRKADTVVRYGGEEFFAILPGADKAAASSVAEKIRGLIPAV